MLAGPLQASPRPASALAGGVSAVSTAMILAAPAVAVGQSVVDVLRIVGSAAPTKSPGCPGRPSDNIGCTRPGLDLVRRSGHELRPSADQSSGS